MENESLMETRRDTHAKFGGDIMPRGGMCVVGEGARQKRRLWTMVGTADGQLEQRKGGWRIYIPNKYIS